MGEDDHQRGRLTKCFSQHPHPAYGPDLTFEGIAINQGRSASSARPAERVER